MPDMERLKQHEIIDQLGAKPTVVLHSNYREFKFVMDEGFHKEFWQAAYDHWVAVTLFGAQNPFVPIQKAGPDSKKIDESVPAEDKNGIEFTEREDGSTWRWLAGQWREVKPVEHKDIMKDSLDYANSITIFSRENRQIYDAFLRGYEHAVGSKKKSNDSEPNITRTPAREEIVDGNVRNREILENPMTPDEAFTPTHLRGIEKDVLNKPVGSPDHKIVIVNYKNKTLMTLGTDVDSEHDYAGTARMFLSVLRRKIIEAGEKRKLESERKQQDERMNKYGEFRTKETKAPLTKDDFAFFPGIDSDMWKFERNEYPYRYSVATEDAGVSFFCSIQIHNVSKDKWEDHLYSTYKSLDEALELFNRHR